MRPVITLLTDFGYRDYYVAAMKGVILGICPDALIVDIAHGIPKWGVREAAYVLSCCYWNFPRGTIHVVVVDPGVGTERRAVVIVTKNYVFIGPDNGVLIPAAESDGILAAYSIERNLVGWETSHTFHGRDIFAPAAAYLASGRLKPEELGPPVSDLTKPKFTNPRVEGNMIYGEAVYVDDFGNVATNVGAEMLKEVGAKYGSLFEVKAGKFRGRLRLLPSFGHVRRGEPLLLINSCNRLEIAVNEGSASSLLGIKPGDEVVLELVRS